MTQIISTITLLIGLFVGAAAGHFHGKAQVYEGMFEANARVIEDIGK